MTFQASKHSSRQHKALNVSVKHWLSQADITILHTSSCAQTIKQKFSPANHLLKSIKHTQKDLHSRTSQNTNHVLKLGSQEREGWRKRRDGRQNRRFLILTLPNWLQVIRCQWQLNDSFKRGSCLTVVLVQIEQREVKGKKRPLGQHERKVGKTISPPVL